MQFQMAMMKQSVVPQTEIDVVGVKDMLGKDDEDDIVEDNGDAEDDDKEL